MLWKDRQISLRFCYSVVFNNSHPLQLSHVFSHSSVEHDYSPRLITIERFFLLILQEEIISVKTVDSCQTTDILQRIWAKALNHVYKKDTASFETVAQFVLQHTESMLFGVFLLISILPSNHRSHAKLNLILVQLEFSTPSRCTANWRTHYPMATVIGESDITW